MQVESILQSKGVAVHTVASHARVADAVRVLNTQRIGAVVVVEEGGEVAGILSERDIVRKMGDDPTRFLQKPVAEVMTRSVVTCQRSDFLSSVMEQMTEFRIRHVPVCEDGALVGIVSIGDVVKWQIAEVEQEAVALRAYIAS
jgi:CBS domain-containing protein